MSGEIKIPAIEEVMDSMNTLFSIIDLLDNNYKKYKNNYLMRHFKNKGISIREIFILDMLDWLCFLGGEDGYIDVNEVLFINLILNLKLSQSDIMEIVKNLDVERLTTLPIIFAIFIEYEEVSGVEFETSIVDALFSVFFATGSYLIVCDGSVDENEIKGLSAYMDSLRYNISTFNLDSIHDYILDQI